MTFALDVKGEGFLTFDWSEKPDFRTDRTEEGGSVWTRKLGMNPDKIPLGCAEVFSTEEKMLLEAHRSSSSRVSGFQRRLTKFASSHICWFFGSDRQIWRKIQPEYSLQEWSRL